MKNNKWISVKDRLPESGQYQKVLTLTEYSEAVEMWIGHSFECEFPVHEATVTHWMPLPQPPKTN